MKKIIFSLLCIMMLCSTVTFAAETETVGGTITLTQFLGASREDVKNVAITINAKTDYVDKNAFYDISDSLMLTSAFEPELITLEGTYITVEKTDGNFSYAFIGQSGGVDRYSALMSRMPYALYTTENPSAFMSLINSSNDTDFNDIKNHRAKDTIEKCSEWAYYYIKDAESPLYNIMPQEMYGGDFTASVTRQEFCELIYNTVGYMNGVTNVSDEIGKSTPIYPKFSGKTSPFEDTNSEYILALYESGIIKGKTEKTFCPSDYLTREETALIISRAAQYCNLKKLPYKLPFNDTYSLTDESSDAIKSVCGMGIMNGTGENHFSHSETLSKEQAAAIAMRLINCIAHHSEINSELSCYFNLMQMWIEDKDGNAIFILPMYWATYDYRIDYGYSGWDFFEHNKKTVIAVFGSDAPQTEAHTEFYELPSGNKILELPRKAGYFLGITEDGEYIITYDITKPAEYGSWGETVYGVYDFNGAEILPPIYSRDELHKAGYIDYNDK